MEQKRNGYLLGIVGAFIAALIGTIPWIILYVYGNMIYSVLAFVVAIAALKGYELLKGKVDKKLPFIIAIISILAITIATLIIIPNLLLLKELGTTSLANFKMIYADSEFSSAIIGDYITSLLFTVLGMGGVISSINKQVKSGSTKIDLNYKEEKISQEEKENIRKIFEKYNALNKNNAISKEVLMRELEYDEDSIKYLVSLGIIKVYKKNYYYKEVTANSLRRTWIIIAVVFVILLLVGIFTSSSNDKAIENKEDQRIITYTIPKEFQEYAYDDESGKGWYYLPNKDLTGESGFIDVSYSESAESFDDIESVKKSMKNSFEKSGYKIDEIDSFKNANGFDVLKYVLDIEDYQEIIYYVFNDKKYAIIDGFKYEDVSNVKIEEIMKEIARDFDWK